MTRLPIDRDELKRSNWNPPLLQKYHLTVNNIKIRLFKKWEIIICIFENMFASLQHHNKTLNLSLPQSASILNRHKGIEAKKKSLQFKKCDLHFFLSSFYSSICEVLAQTKGFKKYEYICMFLFAIKLQKLFLEYHRTIF